MVAGGFGFRRAGGPSGSSFRLAFVPMAAERTRSSSRRDQIVAVAMRHFADQGYRGARIEDVASEVGVAKGTVFLHFGSKEGLFLAAYDPAPRPPLPRRSSKLPSPSPPKRVRSWSAR